MPLDNRNYISAVDCPALRRGGRGLARSRYPGMLRGPLVGSTVLVARTLWFLVMDVRLPLAERDMYRLAGSIAAAGVSCTEEARNQPSFSALQPSSPGST